MMNIKELSLIVCVFGWSVAGVGAAIEVDHLGDEGEGSLRWAIETAEANGEADEIVFVGDGSSGTIALQSPLPVITTELVISGPGADVLTVSGDSDGDGVPDVRVFEISGGGARVRIADLTVSHGLADDDKFWFRQRIGGGLYILRGAKVELEKVAVLHCEAYRIDRNDSYMTGAGIGVMLSDLKVDRSLIAHNVIGRDMRDRGIGAGAGIYALGGRTNKLVITNSTVSNNRMNLRSGASSHAGAVFVAQSGFGFHPHPVKPRGRQDDDAADGREEDKGRGQGNGNGQGNGKDESGKGRGNGDEEDDDEELSHFAFFGSLIDDREYDDRSYDPWDFGGNYARDGWNDGDDDGDRWNSRPRFVVRVESSTVADNFAHKGCAGFVSRNRPQKVLLKNSIFARNLRASHWRFPDRVQVENFHQRGGQRNFPRTTSLGGNVFDDRSGRYFLTAENDLEVSSEQLKLGELEDNGGPTATHSLGEGSVAIGNAVDGAPVFDQRCLVRTDPEDSGAFEFGAGDGGGGNTPPFIELAISDLRVPCDSNPVTIPLHVHFGDAEDEDAALVFEVAGNSDPGVIAVAVAVPGTGELVLEILGRVGTAELRVVVRDTEGLAAGASFAVEVFDNKPPVFVNVPENIVVGSQPGVSGAVVTWTPPTVNDNVGVVRLGETHQPGEVFPIGTTEVFYEAADAAGNTAEAFFLVTVEDDRPPVITGMPADIRVCPTDGGGTAIVVWEAPVATDDSGEVSLVSTHQPGDEFDGGETEVTYMATDGVGNVVSESFTVTVVGLDELANDTEPPVFSGVPERIVVNNDPGEVSAIVWWTPPTATDNVCLEDVVCSHEPGDRFCIGTTIVSCTATDHAGNSTTVEFFVTVKVSEGELVALVTSLDIAPGAGTDRFEVFESAYLSNSGTVMFEASLEDGIGGMWRGKPGNLELVAMKGDPLPGGAVGTMSNFLRTFVSEETGEVAFLAEIAGVSPAQEQGHFFYDSALRMLVQRGMSEPLTGGTPVVFGNHSQSLNHRGEYFYYARLATGAGIGSRNDEVVYSSRRGVVMRDGDPEPVPSLPGATFVSILNGLQATRDGALALRGFLTGVPLTSREVVVVGQPGAFRVAARSGDAAPGTEPGITFQRFLDRALNEKEKVAIVGILQGTGVTAANRSGIWSDAGGSGLELVLRAGVEAPAIGDPGVTVTRFDDPLLCDNGIIYIKAILGGTGVTARNNDVLYSYVPGSGLSVVVREGEAFPGSDGAVADAITSYSANGFGNLAFTVDLRVGTAGVTFENSEGIWIFGGIGEAQLLVRSGGEIEMEPGDTRTVLSVKIPMRVDGGTGGRPSGISDFNIAVTVEFTPKESAGAETGIFILGACPPHPPGF